MYIMYIPTGVGEIAEFFVLSLVARCLDLNPRAAVADAWALQAQLWCHG